MKRAATSLVKNALEMFGLGVTRYSTLEKLRNSAAADQDIRFLKRLNSDNAENLIKYLSHSKSQIRQDLFVLACLGFKRNGYFVEFGASNGVDLSNTHLMEKEFGWKGILAEPATCWHDDLRQNRECHIDTGCVWKTSNARVVFNQVEIPDLSTIDIYSDADMHKNQRKNGKTYDVSTISLEDLLIKYKAPKRIDYMSIDTEGSEYEILENFDFSSYQFSVITCEHNYSPMREKIHALLGHHGYKRVFEDISQFDDWYVRRDLDPPAGAIFRRTH